MKTLLFYIVLLTFLFAYFLKAKRDYRRLLNEKADKKLVDNTESSDAVDRDSSTDVS